MENVIICGSKKYDKLDLNPIVDYFNFIIRHNMNVSDNNYGKKKSNLQILNTHVYKKYTDLSFLLKTYSTKTSEDKIKKFYNIMKESKSKVTHYNNNNTNSFNYLLKNNNITPKISKQIRCGLSYIPIAHKAKKKIFMIGYSLIEEDYLKHQINIKMKSINTNVHSRKEEIEIIKKLHSKDIIDLTFSTLLDTPIPTLDNNILEPKKESIDILLDIYNHIEVVNKNIFLESKLSDFFLIKDNKVYIK